MALAKSFAYVLEDIPTHHLERCFHMALMAKTNTFPLSAHEVKAQYEELLPELQRQAQLHASKEVKQLRVGYGSLEEMGHLEWKRRHNLPDNWRAVDGYPPESDLYRGAK